MINKSKHCRPRQMYAVFCSRAGLMGSQGYRPIGGHSQFHPAGGGYRNWWWIRLTRRDDALRLARLTQGEARRMRYGQGAWDAPTFHACSDSLADYRKEVTTPL